MNVRNSSGLFVISIALLGFTITAGSENQAADGSSPIPTPPASLRLADGSSPIPKPPALHFLVA